MTYKIFIFSNSYRIFAKKYAILINASNYIKARNSLILIYHV